MKEFIKKTIVFLLGVVTFFLLFGESDGTLAETLVMKLVGLVTMCCCFQLVAKWNLFNDYLDD